METHAMKRILNLQPNEIVPFWIGLAGLIFAASAAFALNAIALTL
jgi:hypothetical protein